jgi:hypothetical protein
MIAAGDQARPAAPSANEALEALTRLVAETEQRRDEQIRLIADLGSQQSGAAAAEQGLAERVLKEIETTLGMARAYQSILQSLDGA